MLTAALRRALAFLTSYRRSALTRRVAARLAARLRGASPAAVVASPPRAASSGFESFYDSRFTADLVQRWSARHPDLAQADYFVTHAGRIAFLIEAVRRLGVTGDCLDVGGTARTRGLLGAFTDLASIDLTQDVDLEVDRWADQAGVDAYDLVVFSEVIEHLGGDPALALHEINRCLKPGGHLLLTTVNVGSELGLYHLSRGEAPYAMANLFGTRGDRHQREYAPLELQRLVAAHGFETWTVTVNLYQRAEVKEQAHAWFRDQTPFDQALHGDTIVVVGRKARASERPRWLHPIYHASVAENRRGEVPADVAELVRDQPPDWLADLATVAGVARPRRDGPGR